MENEEGGDVEGTWVDDEEEVASKGQDVTCAEVHDDAVGANVEGGSEVKHEEDARHAKDE
jgi:hypothetical protein